MPEITVYDDNTATILHCNHWEIMYANENRILSIDFTSESAILHMNSVDATFLPVNIELMDSGCFHYMVTNAIILSYSEINDSIYGTNSFCRYILAFQEFYNIEEQDDNHYLTLQKNNNILYEPYEENITKSFKVMLNKIVEEI